jgi:hypothetical protein
MALPPMTPKQRADALQKAAQFRAGRKDVKDRLKAGTLTLADLIKDGQTSDVTGRMKVSVVIQSLPGMGKAKTTVLMERLGIAENRRVAALTARQRAALETAFAPA